MKLTKQWLKKHDACSEGYDWYLQQKETDLIKILKMLLKQKHFDWGNWLITKKFDRVQRIKYAVYSAKQVLHIFEKKYPDDKRPRNASNAAIRCIKNNTNKNRFDARDAGADAGSAAWYDAGSGAGYAAWSAGYAARSATGSATGSALLVSLSARSARSAGSALSAARYAGAVRSAIEFKILKHGISLLQRATNNKTNTRG